MKEKMKFTNIPFLFAFCVILGMLGQYLTKPDNIYQYLLLFSIILCCGLVVYWKCSNKMDYEKLIFLLFLLAFIARLIYILEISIVVNQHDTRSFSVTDGNYGHTGYIRYFIENKSLPDFDVRGKSQFYHPPLHHIISAVWIQIQTAVGISFEKATENLQILTLFYSMVSLYAVNKILDLIQIKEKIKMFVLLPVAFHPTFFLLAGSINNDCLSIMFVFLAVWATLYWYRNPKWYNIILVALCIGLSMLAKLATGLIAPATAFIFLYKFVKDKGAKKKWKYVGQFAVFGSICIPLGIGWQLRNYLKFSVPLTYVPKLSVKADQYLGNYSVTERLFDFKSLKDFGVFPARVGKQGAEYFEHCIPLAAIKTSLFGEYSNWMENKFFSLVGTILFIVSVILILIFCYSFVFTGIQFIQNKKDSFLNKISLKREEFLFFVIYLVTILISYVSFCFEYPHFCSMDFRYIVPLLLIGTVFTGIFMEYLDQKKDSVACRVTYGTIQILCAAFAVFAVCLYPFFYV